MFLTCRYRQKLTILGDFGSILGDFGSFLGHFGPFWQKGEKQAGRTLDEDETNKREETRNTERQKTNQGDRGCGLTSYGHNHGFGNKILFLWIIWCVKTTTRKCVHFRYRKTSKIADLEAKNGQNKQILTNFGLSEGQDLREIQSFGLDFTGFRRNPVAKQGFCSIIKIPRNFYIVLSRPSFLPREGWFSKRTSKIQGFSIVFSPRLSFLPQEG